MSQLEFNNEETSQNDVPKVASTEGSRKPTFVKCPVNGLHIYDSSLAKCPYCELDRQLELAKNSGVVIGFENSETPTAQPDSAPTPNFNQMPKSTFAWPPVLDNSSGSSTLQKSMNKSRQRSKLGFKNKLAIFLAAVLCTVLIAGGIFGGIYYKKGMDEVNATIAIIDSLPDNVTSSIENYDELISYAYEAYDNLEKWQKNKVTNKDKLLIIIPQYNQYRVDLLRSVASGVAVETVAETDALKTAATIYDSLTEDQKALLSAEEIALYDNYSKAYSVVLGLSEFTEEAMNNPSETIARLRAIYYSIPDQYKALVYNYSNINTFEENAIFLKSFAFNDLGNSYSVSLKEGETLSGVVAIPARFNGKDVSAVTEGGFQDCTGITAVVIPETVTEIGVGAFKGCSSLESVSLPFTGKSAEAEAYEAVLGYIFGYKTYSRNYKDGSTPSNNFYNWNAGSTPSETIWQYTCLNSGSGSYYSYCSYYYYIPTSLKTVTITNQTEAKVAAFNGCTSITNIQYTGGFSDIGEAAFQSCQTLSKLNSESDKTFVLNGTYETIGSKAFYQCFAPTTLTISSENLKTIEESSFESMGAVTEITIPNTVERMSANIFKNCTSLTTLSIPFTGFSMDEDETEVQLIDLFGEKTSALKKVVVTVQSEVKENAFYNWNNIENIQYSNGITIIHNWAFGNCSNLKHFNTSNVNEINLIGVTVVGDSAFSGCSLITSVTFSSQLNRIGNNAFQNLSKIRSIVVPNSVTEIGLGAFKGCSSLENISLPFTGKSADADAYEAVFGYVFGYETGTARNTSGNTPSNEFYNDYYYYSSKPSGTWQYTCRNYGSGSSYYYQSYYYGIPTSLKTVTITSQTEVKVAAFNGCTSLTDITFSNGINTQGDYAFQNCTATIHDPTK